MHIPSLPRPARRRQHRFRVQPLRRQPDFRTGENLIGGALSLRLTQTAESDMTTATRELIVIPVLHAARDVSAIAAPGGFVIGPQP
jgi:hypothetical protein